MGFPHDEFFMMSDEDESGRERVASPYRILGRIPLGLSLNLLYLSLCLCPAYTDFPPRVIACHRQ
jgi:hypothetical protein